MKRSIISVLAFLLVLLTACGQAAPTWQEQYDLGVRYLSEGNYEEAIIAFTAAIEIDPKRAEAYIGLADVYTEQGDTEKAAEVLQQAIEAIGETESLTAALEKVDPNAQGASTAGGEGDSGALEELEGYPKEVRHDYDNGTYSIVIYDQFGQEVERTHYNADGTVKSNEHYDGMQRVIRKESRFYEGDPNYEEGSLQNWLTTYSYSDDGRSVDIFMSLTSKDGITQECGMTHALGDGAIYVNAGVSYSFDGNHDAWVDSVSESDANGERIRFVQYNPDGTVNRID